MRRRRNYSNELLIADSSYEENCVQLFPEKHRDNTVTEAASPFMWQKLSLSCSEVMSTLQTYYAEWATKSTLFVLCQLVTFSVSGTLTCWLQIVCRMVEIFFSSQLLSPLFNKKQKLYKLPLYTQHFLFSEDLHFAVPIRGIGGAGSISSMSEDFGVYGSDPRSKVDPMLDRIPIRKTALTAGTPKGTLHIPGSGCRGKDGGMDMWKDYELRSRVVRRSNQE